MKLLQLSKNKGIKSMKDKQLTEKPKWLVEPLDRKKIHHGCLNCCGTDNILGVRTKLYNGFGGWMITKDGKLFFMEKAKTEFEDSKTLLFIEKIARQDPNHDWRAIFDMALSGGQYQRHGKNRWVLIESNQGFA